MTTLRNAALLGALGAGMAGAAAAASAEPRPTTWNEVEPLLRARFGIESVGGGYSYTTTIPVAGDVPQAIRDAVEEVTSFETPRGREALLRIGLSLAAAMSGGAPAGPEGRSIPAWSEALREALFADQRATRVLRAALGDALEGRGVRCEDCRLPDAAPRSVAFADFVPYLARFVYCGRGDLSKPDGGIGFHVCSGINGLKGLEAVDPDLAGPSLSAMFRMSRAADGSLQHAGNVLKALRAEHPGPETPELLEAINTALAERLSRDRAFLDPLRPLVAEEAAASGLACADCALPEKPTAPSGG